MHTQRNNGWALSRELDWLEAVINLRFAAHFGEAKPDHHAPSKALAELPAPAVLHGTEGAYAALVSRLQLQPAERLLLILALAPYLAPERLDAFLVRPEQLASH